MSENLIEHIGLLIATILSGMAIIYFRRREKEIASDKNPEGKTDVPTLSASEYEKIINEMHNQIESLKTEGKREL